MHTDFFSDLYFIERFLPLERRKQLLFGCAVAFFSMLGLVFGLYLVGLLSRTMPYLPLALVVSAGLWLHLFVLDFFAVSRGREITLAQLVAGSLVRESSLDLPLDVVRSTFGKEVLIRAGVPQTDLEIFSDSRIRMDRLVLRKVGPAAERDPRTLFQEILAGDEQFARMLAENGVNKELLLETASLVLSLWEYRREQASWWSLHALGRVRGVGKRWSFRVLAELERYGRAPSHFAGDPAAWEVELEALEKIFNDAPYAKVILEGDKALVGEYLSAFLDRVEYHPVSVSLQEKRVFILDTNLLLGRAKGKVELESILAALVNEAVHAGVLLFVVEEWSRLEAVCAQLGVALTPLFSPLIHSSRVALLLTHAPAVAGQRITITRPAEAELLRRISSLLLSLETGLSAPIGYLALRESLKLSADDSPGKEMAKAKALLRRTCESVRHLENHLVRHTDVQRIYGEDALQRDKPLLV